MNMKEPGKEHHKGKAFLIVLTLFTYLCELAATAFFVGFAPNLTNNYGAEENTTVYEPLQFDTEVSPASWVFFIIWAVIFIWQFSWLVYSQVAICRITTDGDYFYIRPNVLPSWVYAGFIINNLATIGYWICTYYKKLPYAGMFICIMAIGLYISIFTSCRALAANGETLVKLGLRKDIVMIRLFFHNGMGVYAAWCNVALLVQFSTVGPLWLRIDRQLSATIILAIVSTVALLWFALDMFALDRWTRFFVTPYMVLVFALSGILYDWWNPIRRNPIFTAALLAVAAAMLLVKVIVMIVRHCRNPQNYENEGTLQKI